MYIVIKKRMGSLLTLLSEDFSDQTIFDRDYPTFRVP